MNIQFVRCNCNLYFVLTKSVNLTDCAYFVFERLGRGETCENMNKTTEQQGPEETRGNMRHMSDDYTKA